MLVPTTSHSHLSQCTSKIQMLCTINSAVQYYLHRPQRAICRERYLAVICGENTCTFTPTHQHLYTYTCTFTPTPTHQHLHTNTCTFTPNPVYPYLHIHTNTCTPTPAHSHLHIHTATLHKPSHLQAVFYHIQFFNILFDLYS